MQAIFYTVVLFFGLTWVPPAGSAEVADFGLPSISQEPDSCRQHIADFHSGTRAEVKKSVQDEILAFRPLAERALSLRAATIKAGQQLQQKSADGKPLSGGDLALLSEGLAEHLSLRKEMLALATVHECWLDLSPKELASVHLTPETRLQGIMLSLSAALVLYDNYLLAISLFEGDAKLRRLLNEGDPGYAIHKAELAQVTLNYNSIANRSRVRKAVAVFEREMKARRQEFAPDSGADYLAALIAQSPSYEMVKKWSPLYVIGRKIGFLGALTYDSLTAFERDGVSVFSMLFGNTVGLVETRKGKLYQSQDVLADLRGRLRSGDILLEKTPFRLTDKLIPGYWGHAAVWIGTEEELREMGVWDHPVVTPYHDEIRNGRLVVEALRSGVEMNTLEHFLNIDSIGVLRKPTLSREDRARIVLQALRQVGKAYDFNFDVESNERVYCSKLVYLAYQDVEWPTKRSLGRATFTPDDVAARAVTGGDLKLIEFYHDGVRVTENPVVAMAEQMGVGAPRSMSVASGN